MVKPPHRKLIFVLIVMLLFFTASWVVQLIWNTVLLNVLHVPAITYSQATGLLLLCKILFGGFSLPGRQFLKPPDSKERFMHMTGEERTRFKEEYKARYEKRGFLK